MPDLVFDKDGMISLTFDDSIFVRLMWDDSRRLRLVGIVSEELPKHLSTPLIELMLSEALNSFAGGIGIGLEETSRALVTFQVVNLEKNKDIFTQLMEFVQVTEVWIRYFKDYVPPSENQPHTPLSDNLTHRNLIKA